MEKKLKICLILPFFHYSKDMRVPPQIGICSYLINFGHNVDWIIWSSDNPDTNYLLYDDLRIYTTFNREYLIESSLYFKIFNRLINIPNRMRSIYGIYNKKKYDLILVRDDVFDGLIAAYIKYRFNVPFVFILSNPIEQESEYLKIVGSKPCLVYCFVIKFFSIIANRLLHYADLITPISKSLGEHLAAQGISNEKIFPVPEGINVETFRNLAEKETDKKYYHNKLKIIIYIGTLGKGRRLDLLIQAFSEVRKKRADVKLLIVGDGDGKDNLKEMSLGLGIDRDVIFTGQVSHAEIPSFIAASDIGVSPVPPFSFYRMSSPIKMFEYMAMAKPVIANEEIPEHKEVLEKSSGGILVRFTPEAFADAMIKLLDNPERANKIGRNGQEWITKNRTYKIMARQLEDRLYELINFK